MAVNTIPYLGMLNIPLFVAPYSLPGGILGMYPGGGTSQVYSVQSYNVCQNTRFSNQGGGRASLWSGGQICYDGQSYSGNIFGNINLSPNILGVAQQESFSSFGDYAYTATQDSGTFVWYRFDIRKPASLSFVPAPLVIQRGGGSNTIIQSPPFKTRDGRIMAAYVSGLNSYVLSMSLSIGGAIDFWGLFDVSIGQTGYQQRTKLYMTMPSLTVNGEGNSVIAFGNGTQPYVWFYNPKVITAGPPYGGTEFQVALADTAMNAAFVGAVFSKTVNNRGFICVMRLNGAGPTGRSHEIIYVKSDMSGYYGINLVGQTTQAQTAINAIGDNASVKIDNNGVVWYSPGSGTNADRLAVYYSFALNWQFAPYTINSNLTPLDLPCYNPCDEFIIPY